MSEQLFARLYLDEDVDVLVKQLLGARGYDVLTTLEAQRLGASDVEQLSFAVEQGRVVVTHNRSDFDQLAAECVARGHHHAGIVAAVRRPSHQLGRRLMRLLDQVSADEFADLVLYI